MTTRASAARYARALFDVALAETDVEQAGHELSSVGALWHQHPDLQRVLTNPAVPAARKTAAVEELLLLLRLSSPVAKLLLLLAERDRLALIPDMVEVYRERLMEHQHVISAEITTAAPLAAERLGQLQQRLARATGRTVTLTTKVDPQLIGGVVARIGSIVYDGSIATQLTRFRDRMISQR
jgi:F-type H+-transporting ATPase subunit delta